MTGLDNFKFNTVLFLVKRAIDMLKESHSIITERVPNTEANLTEIILHLENGIVNLDQVQEMLSSIEKREE